MTIAQKVFWFFAVCLVGNIAFSMAGVPSMSVRKADPVIDMSIEAQCKTSKHYTQVFAYNGIPIVKDTVQCFNNLVILSEKL